MKREQKRLQRKKARYERSRRQANPLGLSKGSRKTLCRLHEVLDAIPPPPVVQPPDITEQLGQCMKAMGVPLPLLEIDKLEVVKDAEVAQPERLENKGP